MLKKNILGEPQTHFPILLGDSETHQNVPFTPLSQAGYVFLLFPL
jgi:hypothetical protein